MSRFATHDSKGRFDWRHVSDRAFVDALRECLGLESLTAIENRNRSMRANASKKAKKAKKGKFG